MAVRSMTAYATTSVDTVAGNLTIELKSVNSRFLDLQFRMNDEFRAYEPFFRETIMQGVKRGKVECRLSFARGEQNASVLSLNHSLFLELSRLQHEIRQRDPQAQAMTVNELLRWPGMIEEAVPDQETLQQQVRQAMIDTLDTFTAEREREGAALAEALVERVVAMQQIVGKIEPLIPQMVEQFKQKAVERMQEALGVALSDSAPVTMTQQEASERIRQEVTLYGMRIDVAEELSRLKIHLDETKAILEKGGLVGKRMDFMLQELNREANTLGSKAAIRELSDASMELKLLIEQIREQVQNLE
ncbi:YicC family protein [Oxalobacter aliiformigenes]|uniref:YicC/YloC family endoribonuclease n=1 Tax=Oxalobacter aliiformigenes TaxID=2946593 RepID=UPI0022AF0D3A|nr:YicC/YloC family endoribonuclease [Oxalobacter aliiformigenes]MCZ4064416.1 YicC family protein [Oxalobacter aliiformigenes]WAV99764.1 YicC family protein [Oxalobacter aliiformigenes]